MLVLTAWAFVVGSTVARAAVSFPIPRGWSDNVPSRARARAEAWAEDASLQRVVSPTSRDDFAETLAVIARPGPLLPHELDDDEAALARISDAAAQMIGIDEAPDAFERVLGDPTFLRARWTSDDTVVRIALVPTGPTHTAIVFEVERGTDVLYADVFEDALVDMTGASAPVLPFPRGRWLTFGLVLWGVIAAVGVVVVARVSRPTPGPATMGRNLGLGTVGLTLLVAIVVYVAASGREVELTMAGLSRPWLAWQVAGAGLVVAAGLVVLGRTLERTGGVIASAPSAGAYMPHGRPLATPPRPVAPPPVGGSPARPPVPVTSIPLPVNPPPAPPARGPVPAPAALEPGPSASPTPPAGPPSDGFPAPGRTGIADLLLDEPSAMLEHVHEPIPEQTASLATAQITLDGRRGGGSRFGKK